MKANTINVGPLCKYVNNHTKFSVLLSDAVEEWGAELPDKYAAALFDKVEFTCGLFMENSSTGVENIAQLLFVEMKDILKVLYMIFSRMFFLLSHCIFLRCFFFLSIILGMTTVYLLHKILCLLFIYEFIYLFIYLFIYFYVYCG